MDRQSQGASATASSSKALEVTDAILSMTLRPMALLFQERLPILDCIDVAAFLKQVNGVIELAGSCDGVGQDSGGAPADLLEQDWNRLA